MVVVILSRVMDELVQSGLIVNLLNIAECHEDFKPLAEMMTLKLGIRLIYHVRLRASPFLEKIEYYVINLLKIEGAVIVVLLRHIQ